jgi:hypothetical protein
MSAALRDGDGFSHRLLGNRTTVADGGLLAILK